MTVIHDNNANPIQLSNPLPVRFGYDSSDAFNLNATAVNATTAVKIKDATSGKSIYITDVVISSEQAGNVSLVDEDGTVIIGPLYVAANSNLPMSFSTAKKVVVSKALMVKTGTSIHITVSVDGYVA